MLPPLRAAKLRLMESENCGYTNSRIVSFCASQTSVGRAEFIRLRRNHRPEPQPDTENPKYKLPQRRNPANIATNLHHKPRCLLTLHSTPSALVGASNYSPWFIGARRAHRREYRRFQAGVTGWRILFPSRIMPASQSSHQEPTHARPTAPYPDPHRTHQDR